MPDLNEEILKSKGEGMSLRQIAVALGISHEAVRKRLKAVKDKDQVSTDSKPRKSRASEELGDTVNRVSTKETPSHTLTEGVNPSGNHPRGPLECMKGVFQEVLSKVDSLSEEIKQFLESKGIEIYRMQVNQEAYQVKHNGQTIRFYVFREKRWSVPSPPGTGYRWVK